MRLPRLLRGAPPAPQERPRRRARDGRADAPRTIVPPPDGDAPRAAGPFDVDLDAARERLRRAIPPVADDDA